MDLDYLIIQYLSCGNGLASICHTEEGVQSVLTEQLSTANGSFLLGNLFRSSITARVEGKACIFKSSFD
jgi:hypothetical protein